MPTQDGGSKDYNEAFRREYLLSSPLRDSDLGTFNLSQEEIEAYEFSYFTSREEFLRLKRTEEILVYEYVLEQLPQHEHELMSRILSSPGKEDLLKKIKQLEALPKDKVRSQLEHLMIEPLSTELIEEREEKIRKFYESLNNQEIKLDNTKTVKTVIHTTPQMHSADLTIEGYPGSDAPDGERNLFVFSDSAYTGEILISSAEISHPNLKNSWLYQSLVDLIAEKMPNDFFLSCIFVHPGISRSGEALVGEIKSGKLAKEKAEQMLLRYPLIRILIQKGFNEFNVDFISSDSEELINWPNVMAKKVQGKKEPTLEISIEQ
ncbi:MAG TPA: hypothetical protein VGO21_01295 [Candidatus Paceibacterota bacterium]|nr:hypothetical protein [Candidatus Paceibacterota bacterium]